MAPRLIVVWRVTERCDTACPFCAYDRTLRRTRRELDAATAVRFGELIARWARARGREVLVAWLGGEPFLWRPLARVTEELRALGLRVGLTSNGRALADPRTRRWACANLDELTLSIDGPPRVHDALRGGGGAALLAALGELRGPLLRVNTVVMRDNVAAFEELVERAAAAGAHEITFNALGGNDRPAFHAEHHLRPEDLDVLEGALARLRARGLPVRGGDGYLVRLRATAARRALPVDDCGPGRSFWFIEVDGVLSPCSFTGGVPIAELRDLADLDALPERLRASRASVCGDCPSTQVHAKFA